MNIIDEVRKIFPHAKLMAWKKETNPNITSYWFPMNPTEAKECDDAWYTIIVPINDMTLSNGSRCECRCRIEELYRTEKEAWQATYMMAQNHLSELLAE